jgi:hypothetical protein
MPDNSEQLDASSTLRRWRSPSEPPAPTGWGGVELQGPIPGYLVSTVDAIALRVLSAYSIERMGSRLVIEVDQTKLASE